MVNAIPGKCLRWDKLLSAATHLSALTLEGAERLVLIGHFAFRHQFRSDIDLIRSNLNFCKKGHNMIWLYPSTPEV